MAKETQQSGGTPCTQVYRKEPEQVNTYCPECHNSWFDDEMARWDQVWISWVDAGSSHKELQKKVNMLKEGYDNTLTGYLRQWTAPGIYDELPQKINETWAVAEPLLGVFFSQPAQGQDQGGSSHGKSSKSHSKSSSSHGYKGSSHSHGHSSKSHGKSSGSSRGHGHGSSHSKHKG